MKTVIEMALNSGDDEWKILVRQVMKHFPDEFERFAELVRADERKSRAHSLGPGEMELSPRRNHKDDLYECRRRFSATEVMHGPDFMVEAVAKRLDAEMDRAIRARSNT